MQVRARGEEFRAATVPFLGATQGATASEPEPARTLHAPGSLTESTPDAGGACKRKLLDQVSDAIRTRHYSYRTEEAYVGWIKRFIFFHHKRHPAEMGKAEITQFLTALAVERHVSASTQNQALAAVLFLYQHVLGCDPGWLDDIVRAKRPQRLPVVLTRAEVGALLAALKGVRWMMTMLLYGSGLRLEECLRLRVKDVEFTRNEIVVRDGKGKKPVLSLSKETGSPCSPAQSRNR
jgi:site-specific recombinase XerD